MVITDKMLVVFQTSGLASVVSAHAQLARAQVRLANAQTAAAATTGPKYLSALRAVQEAQMGVFNAAKAGALQAAGATLVLVGAMGLAIDRYVKFGSQVANVAALTGSSNADATKAVVLSRLAGLADPSVIQKAGSSVFSGSGQAALARLGISANPNQSGLELVNKVLDRLEGMPNGLRKTKIMEDIFGKGAAADLLPLLRLTKEQRAQVDGLSGSFSGSALAAIQQYQFGVNMLGQTFLQKLIFPIASQLLPLFQLVVSASTGLLNVWGKIDALLGGVPSWILAMAGFGLAIAGVVRTVMMLVSAYRALAASQAFASIVAGDFSVLGRIALAGSVAAGIGYGLDRALKTSGGSDQAGSSASRFSGAVDKFEANVNRMGDAFDGLKGRGVPGGINNVDVGSIYRAGAIGAIG